MYPDAQEENTGVKHSYPEMSLDMSEVGVCSITAHIFIAEVLKNIDSISVVTSVLGTIFMINGRSLPLDMVSRE